MKYLFKYLLGPGLLLWLVACADDTFVTETVLVQVGTTIIPGSVQIDKQADLDLLVGLQEIRGGLFIGELNAGTDVVDLTHLNTLRIVEGSLKISGNPRLTSLAGLEALESVGRWVVVSGNESLRDLHGLDSLRSVGEGISISRNDALRDLSGLEFFEPGDVSIRLTRNDAMASFAGPDWSLFAGELEVFEMDSLRSLQGLEDLQSARAVRINSNATLHDVSALSGLQEIGTLRFWSNPSLVILPTFSDLTLCGVLELGSLPRLESLATTLPTYRIHQSLTISDCSSLPNLDGLEGVTNLTGFLQVIDNDSLHDIQGLRNLGQIGEGLSFFLNRLLCESTINSWVAGIEVGGAVSTSRNANCLAPQDSTKH